MVGRAESRRETERAAVGMCQAVPLTLAEDITITVTQHLDDSRSTETRESDAR